MIPSTIIQLPGLFFTPIRHAERNNVTFVKLKPDWPAAAGLSLARRNCGVVDDQIYIVDVGAAWAIGRFGTALRHAPGTARLLSGRQSFLSKLSRRRHGRAAVPPAKSQPTFDILPKGIRKPRDVSAPVSPILPARKWR